MSAYGFQGEEGGRAPGVGAADHVGAYLEGEHLDGRVHFLGGALEGAAPRILVVEV